MARNLKTKGTLNINFYKDGKAYKCGDQIDVTKDLFDKGYFIKGTIFHQPKEKKIKAKETKDA